MFRKIFFALFICVLFTVPTIVSAQETEENMQRIPYLVAVRGAVRNNPILVDLDDTIEDVQEARDNLQSLMRLRQDAGTLSRAEEREMQRQVADLGASLRNMRATQEMIRIRIEFGMRNTITTINNTELDIRLTEATLEQDRVNLNNAQLRFNAGLISESDLRSKELTLQQRESNLASLLISLESERRELNRILQRPVTGDFYVAFEREIIDLPTNLDQHVRQVASNQPNVRQADTDLNRAQSHLRDISRAAPEYRDLERVRNQAERVRNETLRDVQADMRNRYNTLTMMLRTHDSLEIDLLRAVDRYETLTLNYRAGLATRFDLAAAELGILSTETAIEKNLNTIWNMQFMFEHPFLP